MDFTSLILIVLGLFLFEVVSSIDNAIINAQVLGTMGEKAKRWFLTWGLFFAVFVVRGLLPWAIIWAAAPGLGPVDAFLSTLSSDEVVQTAIESAAPILLMGGGVFLVFLFFHWLFMEEKQFGLIGEKFFYSQGVWFYATVSILLATIVWFALRQDPIVAFGAVVGSTVFFITHGFKQQAEQSEQRMLSSKGGLSDISKLLYLEAIDMTFSIDGVLGAFAFTFSVPLILIGNSLGALAVRQFTMGNIERIKRYAYLKNGAMYSVLSLGTIMLLEAFGAHVPPYVAPVITFVVVGYFFLKSRREMVPVKV